MELQNLYGFVVLLVIVGMVLGAGILALDKFASSSGVTATAATAINNTMSAIADIPKTWMSLIVTIAVIAIILTLIVRSFGGEALHR